MTSAIRSLALIRNLSIKRTLTTSSLVGLGRLNHVAIATPNIEKSSQFYRNLGAKVSESVVNNEVGREFKLQSQMLQAQPEHGVYTVFVELNNTKIELLHPYGDKSPIAAFLEKNKNGGMHHICIEVADINRAIVEVKARNIRLLSDRPTNGAHNKPVVFLHPKDCGGVLIELEQE